MDKNHNNSYLNQEAKRVDLKHEIMRYLRFWPWFLLSLTAALSVAYFNLRYTPKIYTTATKVKILDKSDGIELPSSVFVFNRSNINLENEIEILTSYRIIEEVVLSSNLNTSFYEEGQILTSELPYLPFQFKQLINSKLVQNHSEYRIHITAEGFEVIKSGSEEQLAFSNHSSYNKEHKLPFEILLNNSKDSKKLIDKTYIVRFRPLKSAVLNLKARIKVGTVGKQSDLLKLSLSSQNKEWSEIVLNSLVDIFNRDGINDRQLISKRTLDFIEDRFIYLAEELDSIEINKKEFKQENNLIDLSSDAQIDLQKESESEQLVYEAEGQIALSNLIIDALKNTQGPDGLLPANIGLRNGGVGALISQYNAAILERDKYNFSGGSNNPVVKQLDATILDLKNNIDSSLQAYNLELKFTLSQLEIRNKQFRGEVSRLPLKEKLLREIERQQQIKESLYLFLLQKREEAAINLAVTEPSVKIVEYALSQSAPISPVSRSGYMKAIFGGLLLPFGVLYLMFMLDSKVHRKEDVNKVNSGTSVISEIPKIKSKETAIFTNPSDNSILAESFRILSSNVKFVLPTRVKDRGQVIFCTSTIKGEGKTFVSMNLSLSLSSINKKVLIVGADLRNPRLHSNLNIEKNVLGLSKYLYDSTVDWRHLIINGFEKHPNHDTIISGEIPPNPASLLTNGRFEELIEEARLEYDYIIVDTSPTILVTDTLLVSHLSDATLYVVRANYTDKNLLNFSNELFEKGKLKNMAYVLNGVGASKSYGYNYNYGYNYGYGSEGAKKRKAGLFNFKRNN